jgi:hypothetical protein
MRLSGLVRVDEGDKVVERHLELAQHPVTDRRRIDVYEWFWQIDLRPPYASGVCGFGVSSHPLRRLTEPNSAEANNGLTNERLLARSRLPLTTCPDTDNFPTGVNPASSKEGERRWARSDCSRSRSAQLPSWG